MGESLEAVSGSSDSELGPIVDLEGKLITGSSNSKTNRFASWIEQWQYGKPPVWWKELSRLTGSSFSDYEEGFQSFLAGFEFGELIFHFRYHSKTETHRHDSPNISGDRLLDTAANYLEGCLPGKELADLPLDAWIVNRKDLYRTRLQVLNNPHEPYNLVVEVQTKGNPGPLSQYGIPSRG